MRVKRYEVGSVLFEAILCLLLVVLSLFLNIELFRRTELEVLFQHGAFLFVRNRALGLDWRASQSDFGRLLREALGEDNAKRVVRRIHYTEQEKPGEGLEGKLHLRYPAYLHFPHKHHFELTKKCRFYF